MTKTKLVVNITRGDAVCVSELADRPVPRMRGLIGRRGLPAGEGLLLSPAPGIHTAFMRFPIDALFLDREMRVLRIVERLGPWRVASKRRARAVLELSAGESARRGVAVGDRLELRDREATGGEVSHAPKQSATDMRQGAIVPALQARGGEVARLQPLRVLLISEDSRFRTVMSLLLARRSCSVTTTANAQRVAERVDREDPDVIVIDASRSPVTATLAKIEALSRPVGVVVVGDMARLAASELPVLAKWGPFESFVEAIERADRRRWQVGRAK